MIKIWQHATASAANNTARGQIYQTDFSGASGATSAINPNFICALCALTAHISLQPGHDGTIQSVALHHAAELHVEVAALKRDPQFAARGADPVAALLARIRTCNKDQIVSRRLRLSYYSIVSVSTQALDSRRKRRQELALTTTPLSCISPCRGISCLLFWMHRKLCISLHLN